MVLKNILNSASENGAAAAGISTMTMLIADTHNSGCERLLSHSASLFPRFLAIFTIRWSPGERNAEFVSQIRQQQRAVVEGWIWGWCCRHNLRQCELVRGSTSAQSSPVCPRKFASASMQQSGSGFDSCCVLRWNHAQSSQDWEAQLAGSNLPVPSPLLAMHPPSTTHRQ